MAEIVLAAGIELDVGRQHVAILPEEADQAAVMVDMTVADDQRLHLARVDPQQPDVVDQRRGRVAEVEHDRALLLVALRFQEERQSPLVVQNVAGVGAAAGTRAVVNDPIEVGQLGEELVD